MSPSYIRTRTDAAARPRRTLLPGITMIDMFFLKSIKRCKHTNIFSITSLFSEILVLSPHIRGPVVFRIPYSPTEITDSYHNVINVSSTNYSVQYQRFRRTDVTISSKSLSFFVSPLLNSPLRRGELTPDFVLYRGNSMKFIPFISSNSRSLGNFIAGMHRPAAIQHHICAAMKYRKYGNFRE